MKVVSAILLTSVFFSGQQLQPVLAEEENENQQQSQEYTVSAAEAEADQYLSVYAQTYADVSNASWIFDGYLSYLQRTPDVQEAINTKWYLSGNPTGSITGAAYTALQSVNDNVNSLSASQLTLLQSQVAAIRSWNPAFPAMLDPTPVVEETPVVPETPAAPETGTETTTPETGSTDTETGNDTENKDESADKENEADKNTDKEDGTDKEDNKTETVKPEEDKKDETQDQDKDQDKDKEEDKTDESEKTDESKEENKSEEKEENKTESADKTTAPSLTVNTNNDKESSKDKTSTSVNPITSSVNVSTAAPNYSLVSFTALSKTQDQKITISGLGSFNLLPNFSNSKAWKGSSSPYNTPYLWGQCTWFAWGRFYEIYGFSPSFTGNGYQCVSQLLAAHGDQFELSTTPAAGAVFSSDAAHNHVGIVLDYDEKTGILTIQEGNLDGVSNSNWNEAINDYRTIKVTQSDMKAMYGNVTYAVPKGSVKTVGYTETSTSTTKTKIKTLRALATEKLKYGKVLTSSKKTDDIL
jgi:surface antigen